MNLLKGDNSHINTIYFYGIEYNTKECHFCILMKHLSNSCHNIRAPASINILNDEYNQELEIYS